MAHDFAHRIPIMTTFDPPPGSEVTRVIGPVWGITVRSRSIVGTACAGCQQIFGGEISALTSLAVDSRNEAMHRLETNAIALGANATVVARLTNADPARVRAVARTASSPAELPPAQELYEQIADVLGVTL